MRSSGARHVIASCLVLAGGCRSVLGFEDPLVADGDAGTSDAIDDALECFGEAPFEVCLTSLPTEPLTFSLEETLDTNPVVSTSRCTFVRPGSPSSGPDWCVIVGTDITVTGAVRVTGSRALVLLATGALKVTGTLEASSAGLPGPGFSPTACTTAGGMSGSAGGGGGAGGSFASVGGAGGGGHGGAVEGGVPTPAGARPASLRGGCAGGIGGAGTLPSGSKAGAGGGVVYLIGGTELGITGRVSASGGAGAGGTTMYGGGSGGGSGGLIVMWSPSIDIDGDVVAHGGGGGGGAGGNNQSGKDGSDSVFPDVAAPGGAPGNLSTGRGGGGAAVDPAASALDSAGIGGGGGGGGGYGWILVTGDPAPMLEGDLSPPPTL